MSKVDKRLKKWLINTPAYEPIDTVTAIIKRFFNGQYRQNKTSHIVIQDDRLKGNPDCGPAGDFTVVITGGQRVKGRYLKRLAMILKLLEEFKEE